VKKVRKERPAKAVGATRRRRPEALNEEERILRKATAYLLREHGMFLVATGVREARVRGLPVWVVAVTLRYTTGHEGYVGDLLYDGEEFSFLTPPEVRKERARAIAADPERARKWNDYQASPVPSGEG
jgi:hypothetical protein